ncbi:MAG: LysR family transcriptional regulator [Eggerthellaceae bacterium]|nr:LysR family transcriptional regulator [Eggerthellaceae bacterium]
MNRRHLDSFMAASRHLNFTAAAEELYLSRQALSGTINELEKELGALLFVRRRRGVALTKEGEAFLRYAEGESALWRELELSLGRNVERIAISFGGPFEFLEDSVVEKLLLFEEKEPGVQLVMSEYSDMDFIWDEVREGSLDVGWTMQKPTDGRLSCRECGPIGVHAVMRRSDPLAKLDVVDFQNDLRGRFVMTPSKSGHAYLEEPLAKCGASSRCAPASLPFLTSSIVKEGRLLFAFNGVNPLDGSSTTMRSVTNFPYNLTNCLVYRKDASAEVLKFVDYAAALMSEERLMTGGSV